MILFLRFSKASLRVRAGFLSLAVALCGLSGCGLFGPSRPPDELVNEPPVGSVGAILYGRASYYGPGFHGRLTANGEVFWQDAYTAAHRVWPFGTVVRVTNLKNGLSCRVRINDRGPFINGREIDVSQGVAEQLEFIQDGVVDVRLEIMESLGRPGVNIARITHGMGDQL
jgi:rare lipoprotein A (peptidoglycan hydrolase)